MHFDITIIGAGTAGIEAALEAGRKGLSAILVTNMPVGGRTAYSDLVPAQIMLEAGKELQMCYNQLGGSPFQYRPSITDLKQRIEAAGDDWSRLELQELEKLNIPIIEGEGQIIGKHDVEVCDSIGNHIQTVHSKTIIIATGSTPRTAGSLTPNGKGILLPKQVTKMADFPQSILIVGAGSTGCEYASIFADLMVDVTLISQNDRLLPRFDREIADELAEELTSKGVDIRLGFTVKELYQEHHGSVVATNGVDQIIAQSALLCIGSRPDMSFISSYFNKLECDKNGTLICDESYRTSVNSIYAIGDVLGEPANLVNSRSSAQQVIRTIEEIIAKEPLKRPILKQIQPQMINTNPPIGQIGMIPSEAVHCYHYYFNQLPIARIRNIFGHLKIWVNQFSRIEAAEVLGDGAEELLAIIRIAMNDGICFTDLNHCHYSSPSVAELFSRPPSKVEFQKPE